MAMTDIDALIQKKKAGVPKRTCNKRAEMLSFSPLSVTMMKTWKEICPSRDLFQSLGRQV
jgi:hypothetical protein